MRKTDIISFVDKLKMVTNKDCSEYAEDIKRFLGSRGTIISYTANKGKTRFRHFDGCLYIYHTVVKIKMDGNYYIIDPFINGYIVGIDWYEYKLKSINNGLNIEEQKGIYRI